MWNRANYEHDDENTSAGYFCAFCGCRTVTVEHYKAAMLLSGAGDALGYRNQQWEYNESGATIHKVRCSMPMFPNLGFLMTVDKNIPGINLILCPVMFYFVNVLQDRIDQLANYDRTSRHQFCTECKISAYSIQPIRSAYSLNETAKKEWDDVLSVPRVCLWLTMTAQKLPRNPTPWPSCLINSTDYPRPHALLPFTISGRGAQKRPRQGTIKDR